MDNTNYYFHKHPVTRKVRRSTIKLVPGRCDGWLNAHWSKLADDSKGVIETRGRHYCPHCYSKYVVAMDYVRLGAK